MWVAICSRTFALEILQTNKRNIMGITWKLDPTHSEITFKVRHMMISNVKGNFTDFDAELQSADENFRDAKVSATIKTASISTNNTDRDHHLRSADFFNAEAQPEIKFESDSLNNDVTGTLTMNGVSKPIHLAVDFGGVNVDPWGQTKAGFSFEGQINRKDFGLNWNTALETGGLMVSDEVKIAGELQFVKQA